MFRRFALLVTVGSWVTAIVLASFVSFGCVHFVCKVKRFVCFISVWVFVIRLFSGNREVSRNRDSSFVCVLCLGV